MGDPVLAIAMDPLGGRLGAYVEAGRGQLQRASLLENFSGQLLSLMNHKSGILMVFKLTGSGLHSSEKCENDEIEARPDDGHLGL